jgi:hypothetical protein
MAELLAVVPADRRPHATPAHHVACLLAEDYRENGKGYVDSTHAQLIARCSFASMGRILRALHDAGIWVVVEGHRGGARTTGTRRVPGPVLLDLMSPDRHEVASAKGADLMSSDRHEVANTEIAPRVGDNSTSCRSDRDLVSVDRHTLHYVSPVPTPAPIDIVEEVSAEAIKRYVRLRDQRGDLHLANPTAYIAKRRDEIAERWGEVIIGWVRDRRDFERIIVSIVGRLDGVENATPPAPEVAAPPYTPVGKPSDFDEMIEIGRRDLADARRQRKKGPT